MTILVPLSGISALRSQKLTLPSCKTSSKVNVRLSILPASIEAYLEEAGFSGTEIIVLKKLLEEDALTLRELASKTGKSTGVLDQAVKKLLKKNILAREMINETPKYVMRTLQVVVDWMNDDIALKQEMLRRKHENFETFVRSLTIGKRRPEMEYFEGVEGIKTAYKQLLERGNDFVQYGPLTYTASDEAYREFWVQYFRERRSRGIFARIITHNTPLGRRYQSRDPFEYRKTILVDPEAYPFHFEKVIAGDTVACFQMEEERACFIKYPELAQNERMFFEKLWNKKLSNEPASDETDGTPTHPAPIIIDISPKTRVLSFVREFFLSRKSLALIAVFGIVSASITYGLYRQNIALNLIRIQERVKSIAATGALQFDPADLDQLRTPEDISKPEYKKVIYQLNEIRRNNEGVKYSYILRPTIDTNTWEFVADADSLDPSIKKDLNNDGKIDNADHLSPPGEKLVMSSDSYYQAFITKSATFDKEPYTDQWGTWISGFAPIENKEGEAIALFSVDIYANKVQELTQATFVPIVYFFGFFLLFLLIRLAAFNRPILKELWLLLHMRKVVIIVSAAVILSLAITFGLYRHNILLAKERIRERVAAIAATGALQFSAADLDQLQEEVDMQKPEYAKLVHQLQEIRSQNDDIVYVYLIRPTSEELLYEFIADADAINPYAKIDTNHDGKVDEADTLGLTGMKYDMRDKDALSTGPPREAIANTEPYTDKWGTFMTGYAPIFREDGTVAGLLSVDMWGDKVTELSATTFAPLSIFLILLVAFLLIRTPGFSQSPLYTLFNFLRRRSVLLSILFTILITVSIFFIVYQYTLRIVKEEIGIRLMSIAATAAPEINPDDINQLHVRADMEKDAYQRVFNKLNEIRKNNEKIQWVYIYRTTNQPGIWEFVADADSNYYIPFKGTMDLNNDGKLDEAEENVYPGVTYDMGYYSPEIVKSAFNEPVYSEQIVPDQWGIWLSGYAPIRDGQGKAIAVLGLDMDISDVHNLARERLLFFQE